MKKKILSVALTIALCVGVAEPVFGAGTSGTMDMRTEVNAPTDLTDEENDPQYEREVEGVDEVLEDDRYMTNTTSPYTGGGYNHADRFDGITPVNGIDVSKYQKNIDWNAVKAAGINYAFIRVGYRGAANGSLYEDEYYVKNLKGAIAAGIDVGVYIFSQAVSPNEAVEEANFLLERIRNYKITMPVVIDFEYKGSNEGRLYNAHLSPDTATTICNAFSNTVSAAGYTPMVYANKYMLENKMNASALNAKVWLARYNYEAGYSGAYEFWQYSSKGSVSGISGNVDCDFWYNVDGTPFALNGICYKYNDHSIDVGVAYTSKDSNTQFRWQAYNLTTGGWTTISDWYGGNWATWYPEAGDYWLRAEAKTSDGTIKDYTICFHADRDYSSDYLNLNGICYNYNANSIDIGVAYDSSDSNVKFRWQAYNLTTGGWTTISDWYGGNWATWYPEAGDYWLQAQAMNSAGKTATYTICFHADKNYMKNYISIDGICWEKNGNGFNVGAAYTSTESNVTFKWQVCDLATGGWTTVSDWYGGNWMTWTPVSGDYYLYVQAQSETGYSADKIICFHVD